ncbi:MAG TPA: UDP-N-acetylmuramate dehydrogenase [Terracidiphilus sp.]|jgi:UDP-N-acetylmuramate dehydrogenase|nr:UDP-N-acetylmuramate dehydrogenase [Terracidiphilus sp.]
MLLEENKPLGPCTTFGIGGPARWFVRAQSEDEIVEASEWARNRGIPIFVLGGGSNVLIADGGFSGLVLHIALRGIEEQDIGDSGVLFRVEAGEDWDAFVQRAVDENCAGIECLAGIPGTVGGTPVQNVGAYGQEVAQIIGRVRAFDTRERRMDEFSAAECGFSYRKSRFNSADRGRFIVTRVCYQLRRGGAPALRYADLQREFGPDSHPSLPEVAAAVRRIRMGKGMLLVPGDPDCRSAGSFFKNPIVDEARADRIGFLAGKEPPRFPAAMEGRVKLPAAWLIEQAGFSKGYIEGNTGISTRHTLALINRGDASADEILELAAKIKSSVEKRFGVALQPEPVFVGF